jgi:hypothetical protein
MTGLADFMDERVPSGPGYASARGGWRGVTKGTPPDGSRLAGCGPACRLIADEAGAPALAEQLLASLFWWCKTRTAEFAADSRGFGDAPGQRQIVVNHADGTRHDLLLLAPGVPETFTVTVSGPLYNRFTADRGRPSTITEVALDEAGQLGDMLVRAGIAVNFRAIPFALREMADNVDFRLVVTQPPNELWTSDWPAESPSAAPSAVRGLAAPVSALAVTAPGDPRPLATAGVIGTDADGRLVAVTARHAIPVAEADAVILVGGAPARVVGQDVLTDSCVLEASCRIGSCQGHAGPLAFAPQEHRVVTFDGAASGLTQTRIRGYDLSVLASSAYLSSKVYTEADTVPGDSGAALIDHEDHIVGFAVSRTAFGAPLEFSAWSWARQVLSAHGLS